MDYLERTWLSPEENLACDEALLDWAESGAGGEVLRIWESPVHFIVLGHGNRLQQEVCSEECKKRGIPILRRSSGGGAVLQGPGSLSYALILSIDASPDWTSIAAANRAIMRRQAEAIRSLLPGAAIAVQGHTDLTLDGKKFSGNAQRRKRRFFLFHGTFLLDFDLSWMHDVLALPSRQPDYRGQRSHLDFLCRLPLAPEQVAAALRQAWQAHHPLKTLPEEALLRLAREKYSDPSWNYKF